MSSKPRSAGKKRHRLLVPAVVAGALLLAGGGWWYRQHAAESESGWRTARVEKGDIRVAISATGTLSAISTVTVGSQISGQITEVRVDFNSPVRKGDVLARIDPSTYEAQIAQGAAAIASANASLSQAAATLTNARADYRRKAALGERQLVARGDVDTARMAMRQAEAQIEVARAQIRQQTASTQATRLNLERTVIRSPVDGVVLTRAIEPGQTVAASLQAPELFTIAEDLSKMKIELAVDESDIGQVEPGQRVGFTVDAFPDRQFSGVVEQVRLSATTTSNVVTYPVVVTVDNGDGTLLPGLTVNAEIEVSKREGILRIANAALRYKPSDERLKAMGATPPDGASAARRGGGMGDELPKIAASLALTPAQRAAFDQALADMRRRQAGRTGAARGQADPSQQDNRVMGGGAPDAATQAQMRSRVRERFRRQFAGFRNSLDDARRARWDSATNALINARRAPLYLLADGQPKRVMVRLGVSDGSNTEVAGNIKAGDEAITGERAASAVTGR
ncbi:efflux RND transporter periplasmic adaptor subunit [Lysobacter pythonis]|uniref:Efflux RND transporter periplasmic adaptor subunit n=1 Tax=Solilutibacter pythonis TaxID=2483112 RepID=A0A3M2I2R8_9GAMM|nr:efflux RND transporter periplasmic adaptor subunit [Lysobacter pythonis]RMH93522.1 efflux RND transporter periplasmic adaptor subunit [Lysobacter pythonis]